MNNWPRLEDIKHTDFVTFRLNRPWKELYMFLYSYLLFPKCTWLFFSATFLDYWNC